MQCKDSNHDFYERRFAHVKVKYTAHKLLITMLFRMHPLNAMDAKCPVS
jgi:hypothetical protein